MNITFNSEEELGDKIKKTILNGIPSRLLNFERYAYDKRVLIHFAIDNEYMTSYDLYLAIKDELKVIANKDYDNLIHSLNMGKKLDSILIGRPDIFAYAIKNNLLSTSQKKGLVRKTKKEFSELAELCSYSPNIIATLQRQFLNPQPYKKDNSPVCETSCCDCD